MRFLLSITGILIISCLNAQDTYYTKSGKIAFFSKATIENIEASNRSVTCVLDRKTGNIQFAILMKGFEFEKAMMQEHFNEDYLETDKYPKAEFRGHIENNENIDFNKEGAYQARVKGNLILHGVTREVEADGTITIKNERISATSSFNIFLKDYNIKNDKLNNISNNIRVTVNCLLEPLK